WGFSRKSSMSNFCSPPGMKMTAQGAAFSRKQANIDQSGEPSCTYVISWKRIKECERPQQQQVEKTEHVVAVIGGTGSFLPMIE
ncbi:hypothetical protein P4533_00715, partial [Geobacillus stearothermophilus]|uniref:hypothetical protein n=1 Tax=Geobacillus stearothermophilus TaxID=1422 RepID=UPI002E1C7BB2|nr:hypothetical protein [Geobacillus stearothermophilus]